MFSKIKNMFSSSPSNPTNNQEISFQHPKIAEGDANECPFMKNKKEHAGSTDKCPVSGQNQEKK
jgi:hypothetical protein